MVRPKKRRRMSGALIMWVSIGVVVALVLTFVLVKELSSSSDGNVRTYFGPTTALVFHDVTNVPASALNAVGVTSPSIGVTPPTVEPSQGSYKVGGLPAAFYWGAEYCPYCAATRWGMIIALSRFGTFHRTPGSPDPHGAPLDNMFSNPTDYAPNTPTFSFLHTTYTSKYFAFKGWEIEDRNHNDLMNPPKEVNDLVAQYSTGTFPFMDMDNKVFITESAFDPIVLQGYPNQLAIAQHLDDPSNPVTQAILASANYISAGLCSIAKDPPSSVCDATGVKAAATAMGLKL